MLTELDVVVADCQASGATLQYGSVLELGWTVAHPGTTPAPLEAVWVALPPGTRVSRPVRELTGWSEACLDASVPPAEAWGRLCAQVHGQALPVPCVIHYARFERGFLEDLHRRHGDGAFPLDIV